ncbi:MAG: hypothetical protein AAFY15_15685 [Cyanobacteria bacterium J06648_11]
MPADPFLNPPLYAAIAVTNFFAIVFGLIFKDMLEYQVARWQFNRDVQAEVEYKQPDLLFAFACTCFFSFLFSGCCLLLLAFPPSLAFGIAGVMIGFTAILIWVQMGSLLEMLVVGGSEAMTLDAWALGLDGDDTDVETGDLAEESDETVQLAEEDEDDERVEEAAEA